MRTVRILFAALCTLIGTLVGASALARAQAGPGWEVPANVVGDLTALQPVALGLIALGAILVATSYALDRPAPLPVAVLVVQLLLGVVVVSLATPSVAAQWPVTHPTLSEYARHGEIPIVALCALLGLWGVVSWKRTPQRDN